MNTAAATMSATKTGDRLVLESQIVTETPSNGGSIKYNTVFCWMPILIDYTLKYMNSRYKFDVILQTADEQIPSRTSR